MTKKLLFLTLLCGIFLHNANAQTQPNLELSNKVFSYYDSLSTAVDTLSKIDTVSFKYDTTFNAYNRLDRTFRYWEQFIVTCDSASYISTRSDFAAGSTFLLKAGESFTSPKFSMDIINWYMKVKGTGKALRRLMLFGN